VPVWAIAAGLQSPINITVVKALTMLFMLGIIGGFIPENVFPPVAPTQHMIDGAFILDPELPWHVQNPY